MQIQFELNDKYAERLRFILAETNAATNSALTESELAASFVAAVLDDDLIAQAPAKLDA